MLLSKKTFMVEFSGTLEAGKKTTINTVANMLRNINYKVIVLKESAESLPTEIPKGTFHSNMWMHFITQAGLLKAIYSDADIALIDSEFYGQKFLKEGGCSKEEYEEFERSFLKKLKPNLFMALMISSKEAIKRRVGEGRLVNIEYVNNYNENYLNYFKKIQCSKQFLNTEMKEPYEISKQVLEIILKHYL